MCTTTHPLVSVFIPVYNAGEYLRPALESIINQTYQQIEIIIINDGSTDGCMSAITDIEDPRIIIIDQNNMGKAKALNNAMKIMKGEYWLIQDADDLSYPQRVEKQVAFLKENTEFAAAYVGNDILLQGKQFAPIYDYKSPEQCKYFIEKFKMPAHDATGMYRKAMTEQMWFDEALRIGQGVDYVLRVGEAYPIVVLGECLYTHRINYNSITHRNPKNNIDKINDVIKKACLRRKMNYENYISGHRSSRYFKHRDMDTILTYIMQSVYSLKKNKRCREAVKTAWSCFLLHPVDLLYSKPLLYSIMPIQIIDLYRKVKTR